MTIGLAGALAPVAGAIAKQGLKQLLGNDKLAERAASLAGKGFAQALEKGIQKLGDAIDNLPAGSSPHNSFAVPAAALQLQRLDADGDGSVSRAELQTGLERASERLKKASGGEKDELSRLQTLLTNSLNHYDGLAAMDGQAGLGAGDLRALSAYDDRSAFISAKDWNYFSRA